MYKRRPVFVALSLGETGQSRGKIDVSGNAPDILLSKSNVLTFTLNVFLSNVRD